MHVLVDQVPIIRRSGKDAEAQYHKSIVLVMIGTENI